MNGTSYSLPYGMVFQKYHCSKCGTKLQREKIHRVVTKDDKDYYQYQDYNKFPRRDYDVYTYRFKCPSCNTRISYDEQCVIKRIQKTQGHFILSPSEIKEYHAECTQVNNKKVLFRYLAFPIISLLCIFICIYLFGTDRTPEDLRRTVLQFLIFALVAVVGAVKRYKGNYKLKHKRTYSYEKEAQLERLHAYSSHNKALVDIASQCHCFYCKCSMDAKDVTNYTDNGQTAKCPKCGKLSIIPDSIGESLDKETLSQMHKYWF